MASNDYDSYLIGDNDDKQPAYFQLSQIQKDYLKASIKRRGPSAAPGKGDGLKDASEQKTASAETPMEQLVFALKALPSDKLPQRTYILPVDIARTKTFDTSANLLNPSQMLTTRKIPSSFSTIRHQEFSTPGDRIGRLYTKSAAGLTMPIAGQVSQTMATQPAGKVVGFVLSATAPDAFEATGRVQEIAESPGMTRGKMPTIEVETVEEEPLPSTHSPRALREEHRMLRSQPSFDRVAPSPTRTGPPRAPFEDWNPEPLELEGSLRSGVRGTSLEDKLSNKTKALDAFETAVQSIIWDGVKTAAGSGSVVPALTLDAARMDSVLHKLCVSDEVLTQPTFQEMLQYELSEVRLAFEQAVARACVEYELRDPVVAKEMEIDAEDLYNDDHLALWTNREYQMAEWRVLRDTGIKSTTILKYYRSIESNLFSATESMLELQYLWYTGSFPETWWSTMEGMKPNQKFVDILFTDVNEDSFRTRLPLSLEDCTSHFGAHGREIRNALQEFWLVNAGAKLSHAVASIEDTGVTGTGAVDEMDDNATAEDMEEGGDDNTAFDKFKTMDPAQKALMSRLKIESDGSRAMPERPGDQPERPRTQAQNIVDTAAVLMSRQLREMCERSLRAVADLFDDLNHPATHPYSVFHVSLKLEKVAGVADITTEFTEPVKVCLYPDLTTFVSALTQCLKSVVQSSCDFIRAEQCIGMMFGRQNASMVNLANKAKLNAASVTFKDAVFIETRNEIQANLAKYFEGPRKLLERFEKVEDLLSGKLAALVTKTIEQCTGDAGESTVEGLEVLSRLGDDIERMEELIKELLPDVCYFPVFEVRCQDLKELLIKQVRTLHTEIMNAVTEENRTHMDTISRKYQEIANTLVAESADSSELRTLQDFTNKSASVLGDLYDQYTTQCYERIRFLFGHNYKLTREDMQLVQTTYNWPQNIQTYLKKSFEQQAQRKKELEELLEEDQRQLENDINDIIKRIELVADNSTAHDFRKNCDRIVTIKHDVEQKMVRAEEIYERETLLEVPHTDSVTKLEEAQSSIDPLERLWNTIRQFIEKSHGWTESPLPEVDAEDAERTADDLYRALIKLGKEFDKMGEKRTTCKHVAEQLQKEVKEFQTESVPLMLLICNPGMRERHWSEIETLTGLSIPKDEQLTTSTMLELGLHHYVKEIEETCVSASKEFGLQVAMNKMEAEWKDMIFDTKAYRNSGTRILSSIDEIQQLLDDQIVKTQAMRGSRYIKPFIEQITKWEETLVSMQDILDNWLKVQATWLYLEPIFSSDDIMRQMPTEGKMFRAVDNTWRQSMSQTHEEPACVKVARRPGFLDSLIEANRKLEEIQKGLNDYLETKRLAFPRFFFLSNDELLEILAETKDPLRVQPHLKKCFDGIAELKFEANLDITGAFDPKKEKLDFPYQQVNHKKINPKDSGGNVEKWLIEVESVMKKALAFAIDSSMKDYLKSDRIEWLSRWQGQVLIAINQIMWCTTLEKTLADGEQGQGLRGFHQYLADELMKTVELVRGDIPKNLRTAVGALVVMDVHNRDVIEQMADAEVQKSTDFDWLAQLRYYWKDDGWSAQNGEPGSIDCIMINAVILYAYEYIGNQARLVITPLTDRCYRTLMGAIHLNLGGAPEGPAGTGKTETVKDLGKAIAIQCVVTNCSDGLDYLAMAKFFKGLASSGAWACFDEFNRIQLEVLSVIAQQIMQIQYAKYKKLERFTFEGTELGLKMTCCPFITMNPGYAGRAELPDNLKVLFRTVAMMVPDYAMISEIILYSFGYTNAKPLAVKIVTTYKLCSEQLSSQSHYDYGMRAVISVLRAAGNLKRAEGHLLEDVLVLRSIIDVNLPKFLSPDVPLFAGITSDLFPGVVIDPPDRDNMETAFKDVCLKRGLIDVQYFWDKVVQIYDMMVVRHGFMIVGDPFAGKSSSWKTLAEVLGLLSDRFPEDKRWSKVIPILQNPKSITMGQLYGMFDPVSHEWTDGVLAINYRNAASNKIGTAEDRKWVMFDGPVDALWIENMNTVLDDNKKLCLMSGEIIAMTDVMSMIFEPMDLLVASPATVSRCGMIYLEPEQLGWKPICQAWVETHCEGGRFFVPSPDDEGHSKICLNADIDRPLLEGLVDWLVEPCLCAVRKEVKEMSPTVDTNLVVSMLRILGVLLEECMPKYVLAEGQTKLDAKQLKAKQQDIECSFLFALVWSIGKTGQDESQRKFCTFLENTLASIDAIESDYPQVWNALQMRKWVKPDFLQATNGVKGSFMLPMPMKQDFYECVFDTTTGKWKYWQDLLDNHKIAADASYSSIVVPNSATAQYAYLLQLLLPHGHHVLMCGATGTGKSVYVNNTISSVMDQSLFKPLCLGFSAKTSANMTQDIIDGKLDKRRKGVYGPPMGLKSIIFVDDLNMPEVETYGAQPPIELMRQLIDNGGWYDLKEKTWRTIIDTTVVSAMGPPGGGRNFVTPRLLRHFNLFCFSEFDDHTLEKIFSTIVSWHLTGNTFGGDVRSMGDSIVDATLDTYRAAMANLLPTPAKSHYTFNLRDFSRVIQGVLLCRPQEGFNKNSLIRLWVHEAMRIFSDRLIDDKDKMWFHEHIMGVVNSRFGSNFYDVFKRLDSGTEKTVTFTDMRSLIFGDFMAEQDPRFYEEITSQEALQDKMEEYLSDYNGQSKKPMDLVMFNFAIEHVARVTRIIRMPGGNSLLVGVGGSGRQSVTRLAAFICECNIFQIEISKNYTNTEWREDLKSVLRGAGTGSEPMVFLFSDTQIKNETFVEDINNILNSGEVPNIFPSDERAAICEAVRPHAKQIYGKAAADMNMTELYAFFITRVKQQLHVILAFSPIGDAFRDRLRKFPALINCCTINWFSAWPTDALIAVARRFLKDVKFDDDVEGVSETRQNLVTLCQTLHSDVENLTLQFKDKLNRVNYVTPTSYLELIVAFKGNLATKRKEVSTAKSRYVIGLEKLAFAEEAVGTMQDELAALQPELIASAAATEELMGVIEEKMPGVEATRTTVSAEAAVAQGEADVVMGQKESVEADLAEAIPALESAMAALDTIKPNDINEIKALAKPPEKIKMVCKAVCIMLAIKPQRIPDPDDPTKRIMDFWGPSQKMLADNQFINNLKNYDKDNMNPKIVKEIKSDFVEHEDFKPDIIAKASKAAEGMCRWCHAMVIYDRVVKIVAPKKAALEEAEAKLKVTMDALNIKKAALQKVEDELAELEANLLAAKNKKESLEDNADQCDKKIARANQLLDGLGGEKERWGIFAENLGKQFERLTGDVLISSGLLAYLGPFTAKFRDEQLAMWANLIKESGIPCSEKPSLNATLGNPVMIRQWHIDGLPTDSFSIDNGITVFNARRWPLMIDPQGQANKWIRNMEKSANLQVMKLSDPNYLRTLENAIQFGYPCLLENVGEELDPSLEPLLQKQIFKQGGVNCIRLGDSTIEYSDQFRFYITTKLRNPHYLPEVSVKVTLLNFMITPEGLQDQLLGIVVSQERPDLEAQRNQLIIEGAENKRQLVEIEDKILHILSSSSGNILEDETAIETLKGSKILSDDISKKQKVAEETEATINEVRMSYTPIAFSSQILFFCIADMANIEPVYQYSLVWFINLFISSIRNSEKGRDVAKRLENLDTHFTMSLYRNVCRSLLEKDKLLFSFLLTTRIQGGKGLKDEKEWYYLLTGGMGPENTEPNPAPEWLSNKAWDGIHLLAHTCEHYKEFPKDFSANTRWWKEVYDSLSPQDCDFPGIFKDADGLGRLCALRVIRQDKLVMGIQKYVVDVMGDAFVKPPPFDLQACYADSSAVVPLVFILSAGSDPMGAVMQAAERLGISVEPISLGQGQGPKAERMIQKAKEKGTWVVLQNCHLAPSWMTTLEKTCEDLDPDDTHANFRLWCTTYPSDVFPVAVLQNGVKMTNEPPKGLRANLLGSFHMDPIADEDFFSSESRGPELRRLTFGLCFFHALVQERRLYGPLGWNIPYEFNQSDLRISVRQLKLFLEENEHIPYKAIAYTAGECNYGGRVTDDKDRRTLMVILERFYRPEFLDDEHQVDTKGLFVCPKDGDHEHFCTFIDELPLTTTPDVFGMHDNATLSRDQNDTNKLLDGLLLTEGGGAGGGASGAMDDAILAVASSISSKTPKNFDLEYAALKYPVIKEESMNTVLCQELIRFNRLLSVVRSSLVDIQKAVKGLVVMSAELETLGSALFFNRIPAMWKAKSYPSLKPLAGYVADQALRLDFFGDWLKNKPPTVFWISGFFFTQAFLTGSAQNFARRYTIPIDEVVWEFEMKDGAKEDYTKAPDDGVYTFGLFLEGCKWDEPSHLLAESDPKVLYTYAPVMHWVPMRKADVKHYPQYQCPVYKTSDRRGVLATTGHSSNFVCMINMPSDKPVAHWVERGVAMLTQLDD